MNRVVDVKRVRLQCQSHPLADRELPADGDIHIRVVRRKQPVRSRARDVAYRVSRLIQAGRGSDVFGPRRAILPQAPRKSWRIIRIAGGVDYAAAVAGAGDGQRRPAAIREDSGKLPVADQEVQRLDIALQLARAKWQLGGKGGA